MSDAPRQLTEVADRTTAALEAIFAAEIATWRDLDPMIERPLTDLAEFVGGGGKRIRPAYCYWGFITGGGDPTGDAALAGCCAVELLQAFALVHDDVMDGSPTRRGKPTVWARYIERHQAGGWNGEDRRFGEAAAILVGDIAMVMADRQMGGVDEATRTVWDRLRTELNFGQYLDVVGTAKGDVTADMARTIVANKTAGYTIVRPLQLGAAMAGSPATCPTTRNTVASPALPTNCLAPESSPLSAMPAPVLLAPQSPPSKNATVATAPPAISCNRGSCSLPPARSNNWPARAVSISGVPRRECPMASITGIRAATPKPAPPTCSGRAIPVQPRSTISCHSEAS